MKTRILILSFTLLTASTAFAGITFQSEQTRVTVALQEISVAVYKNENLQRRIKDFENVMGSLSPKNREQMRKIEALIYKMKKLAQKYLSQADLRRMMEEIVEQFAKVYDDLAEEEIGAIVISKMETIK